MIWCSLEQAADYLGSLYELSSRWMRGHILKGQVGNVINCHFDRHSGRYMVEVYSLHQKIAVLTDKPKEYLIGRARSGFGLELASGLISSRFRIGATRWDRRAGSGLLPLLYCSLWADISGTPVCLRPDLDDLPQLPLNGEYRNPPTVEPEPSGCRFCGAASRWLYKDAEGLRCFACSQLQL